MIIKYNNKTINKLAMDSTVYKMYYGGNLVYLGFEDNIPTPPTPSFDGKFLLKYANGTSYSAKCNSSSAITSAMTSGATEDFANVTEIVVGDCVTTIYKGAFSNFASSIIIPNNISAITIGDNVTSIGEQAFMGFGYESLAEPISINFSSKIRTIDADAFGQSNVGKLTFNAERMNPIGTNAFLYCENLKMINNLPINALESNKQQFADCHSLTDVTFNQTDSGTYSFGISESAFYNCTSLTSVTLPYTTTNNYCGNISQVAFFNCISLKSINIPKGYMNIEGHAFYNCTSLSSITFNNVVNIGAQGNTFENCTSLSSITFPNTVNFVGYNLFKGCTSLTSVTFENNGSTEMEMSDIFDESCARTYNMALYASNGKVNILPHYISASHTPSFHTINVTNYNSLTVEDWATIYSYYGWRVLISLNYLTCPYQFTFEPSSTYVKTLCNDGDLYGYYPIEIKYNGITYGYLNGENNELELTEVLLEEGSTECLSHSAVFDAANLISTSGNGITSREFSNGGVVFKSQNDYKTTGSAAPSNARISGQTEFSASMEHNSSFSSVTFVTYNQSSAQRIIQNLNYEIQNAYESTSGACRINNTSRYFARFKLREGNEQQTEFRYTSSTVTQIHYIAFNVEDDWHTNLPPS